MAFWSSGRPPISVMFRAPTSTSITLHCLGQWKERLFRGESHTVIRHSLRALWTDVQHGACWLWLRGGPSQTSPGRTPMWSPAFTGAETGQFHTAQILPGLWKHLQEEADTAPCICSTSSSWVFSPQPPSLFPSSNHLQLFLSLPARASFSNSGGMKAYYYS